VVLQPPVLHEATLPHAQEEDLVDLLPPPVGGNPMNSPWKVPEQRNLAATLSPSATRSTISSRQSGKAARKLLNACRAGSASSGANRSSTSSSLPPLIASATLCPTSALCASSHLPS